MKAKGEDKWVKPSGPPVLLSGGNPQIPKGYGEEPVAAYLEAMPGWKQAAGRQLDQIVSRTVPEVTKAVKWNSPFYGMERDIWFLSFHCMAKYIKVAFFRGASLVPEPPEGSKHPEVRYFHLFENKTLDEAQFADWVSQAARIPGAKM